MEGGAVMKPKPNRSLYEHEKLAALEEIADELGGDWRDETQVPDAPPGTYCVAMATTEVALALKMVKALGIEPPVVRPDRAAL